MNFPRRGSIAVVALAALIGLLGQGGAFAAAGESAVGFGNITPGLPTTGCAFQTVTFDSSVLVYASTAPPGAFVTVLLSPQVHFAGASTGCETLNAGQGNGTLSGGLTGTVNYVRDGNLVTLSGTINGGNVLAGVCLFVPTTVNPVTMYALTCVAASS